ncbi:acyltransferase family protein [Microbacterium sp. K27]|uniref:acyltransferase family protein n=1 Tax=Microbacterium sp. K27 TaxID=2305445 RepID=UPI00144447B1|nr:acyltransferase family protein [Microbacterium sp. K27]
MTAAPAPRVGWPDVAKGICIILVVLWHVVTKHAIEAPGAGPVTDAWATLNAQLLPLRIPLFFLVSGMFAARAVLVDDGSSWRRRAARLTMLYIVWVVIQTFVLALAPDFDTARATSGWELLAQLTISPTNLWYLLALAVYLAIGRLSRRIPAVVVLPVAFVIAAVAGAGVIPDLGNLWQLVQNLFFFLMGLRLRAVVERFAKSVRVWSTVALAAVYVAALAVVAGLAIRLLPGVWPALALIAVAFGVSLSVLLDRHVDVVARPLRWIGQRTLPTYVLHMMPLALIDAVLRSTRGRTTDVVEAVAPILLTAIVIGICLGVHALLVRFGLGALFDPLRVTDRFTARLVPRGGEG